MFIEPSSSAFNYFIFLYLLGFGFSLGSIPAIYVSEILPDIGIGIAFMLNWIACFFVAQGFPIVVDSMGIFVGFGIFALICAFGYCFIEKYVLETKGKTSKEIAEMFAEGKIDFAENVMNNIRRVRFDEDDDEIDRAI